MEKIKKILIAIDGGPASEKVALHGFQLGQQLNTEFALVSVADTTGLMTDAGVTPDELADSIKEELRQIQQLLVDKVFKDYKVLTFVENGKPFEAILKVAEEWGTDLIVLGTHGRTGLSHLLMGSVAEKVIRHSAIPTFIVPSKV